MHRLDLYTLLIETSRDMHQAAAVAGDHGVRAGPTDSVYLVLEHSPRNLGVFYREGAAEAAAHLRLLHFHRLHTREGVDQGPWLADHPQLSPEMAGLVVSDFATGSGLILRDVGTEIGFSKDVHDEFRQLTDARGYCLHPAEQLWFVVK